MQPKHIKLLILSLLLISISAFFLLGINGYFTVDWVKNVKTDIGEYKNAYPIQSAIIFVLIYITGTSISLPVAGILTITGGALFGLVWGIILVSISGTIGASIAFLLSRYLFREYVQNRYGNKLTAINEGISKNGSIYLLTMRLIPVIPYFIINTVMGITPMPLYSYSIITMIGMLPATSILVNGGVQIASLNTIQDIMSFKVLFSFFLIGLIPLLAHQFSRHIKHKQKI